MAAWAIVERDGEILFVKRSARTSRPGQWCLPGGSLHVGEAPGDASVRELHEETGLIGTLGRLALHSGKEHYYECHADPDQTVQLKANECQAYRWIRPESLLELGKIMDLRKVVRALRALGYTVTLTPSLEAFLRRSR